MDSHDTPGPTSGQLLYGSVRSSYTKALAKLLELGLSPSDDQVRDMSELTRMIFAELPPPTPHPPPQWRFRGIYTYVVFVVYNYQVVPDTPLTAYYQGCCGLVDPSRSAYHVANRLLSEVLQAGRPVAFGQPPTGRGVVRCESSDIVRDKRLDLIWLVATEVCHSGATRQIATGISSLGTTGLMVDEICNSNIIGLMVVKIRNSGTIGLMVVEIRNSGTIGLMVAEISNSSTVGLIVVKICNSGTIGLMVAEIRNSGTIGLMVPNASAWQGYAGPEDWPRSSGGGVLHPTLAKDLYTLLSEILMAQAAKQIALGHHYHMALLDSVHDEGRLVTLMGNRASHLEAKIAKLKMEGDPE
ncbi:hypothetical protein BHM03_00020520 [Ensete ventricosum]|nr:hypothetical protein BHM03_00020520 [Ensete ventricosum]